MTDPIVEVRIKPLENALRLSWGMTLTEGILNWKHKTMQVRLYCTPFDDLELGKPTLLNMQASDKQTSLGYSLNPLSFFGVSLEKVTTAFSAGTVFSDPSGRCYPMTIDLNDEWIPSGAIIAYPEIEWSAKMGQAFTAWVQFGYEKKGTFEIVHRAGPFVHHPDSDKEVVLPTVEIIAPEKRARRHRAAPKLFISYAHASIEQANRLANRLSDEFYYDVWIDYDNIPGGANWRNELARGIQQCDVMLYLMTPEAIASPYCRAEVVHAQKNSKRIIPLRMTTSAEGGDLEKVVAGFSNIQYIDLTQPDGFDKLITNLPLNLARDPKLYSDPTMKALHQDYLRSLFARFQQVRSPYMPDKPLNLMDIYVPLKLGVSFNIEVVDEELLDWWLRDVDAPAQRETELPDEMKREQPKPKLLHGFQPTGKALEAWEDNLYTAWKREVDKDGTYRWNRIESETAPALMPYVVITGNPGSGKSTILKHMTLCMAGDMLGREDANLDKFGFWVHPAYTPIFVELRALVRSAFPKLTDTVTLDTFFTYIQEQQLASYQAESYLEALKEQLRDGDAMIFLDGLDEVPDAAEAKRREQIKTLANLLKTTYPDCRIVVTSRPYAYAGDWSLDGFGEVRLSTLDSDRLEELALRLFRVELGQEGAEQEAEAFKEQMQSVPEELRSSPLFFTLMASIWMQNSQQAADQRLPVTKGAIYRECVNMLIERWTRKDAVGQSLIDLIGISEDDLRQLLEHLAFRVHSNTGSVDDAEFAGGEIMNTVMELKLGRIDVWELLDALAQRAGVIYEKAPNLYQFAHRSFQEHLSACLLAGDLDRIIQLLQDDANLWRNVLELLPDELDAAQQQALIEALLPEDDTDLPDDPDHPLWITRYYGLKWLQTWELDIRDGYKQMLLNSQQAMLTKLVTIGALAPVERAEMGRLLSQIGDERDGVGLRADGLPDIAWCDVPAGVFLMGSDKDKDKQARDNETAQHEVDLPAFKIAKYPVTVKQYRAFMQAGGYDNREYWTEAGWSRKTNKNITQPDEWKNSRYNDDNQPVNGVSWYEAYAFCAWLNQQYHDKGLLADNELLRLPTESEWEKAARGTDGRIYPYGDEYDPAKGNGSDMNIGRTSAVGIFPSGASPYGALDMSGNVYDWCLTARRDNYEIAEDNTAEGGATRVVRGGSFANSNSDYLRAAFRDGLNIYGRVYNLGFRCCVCVVPRS